MKNHLWEMILTIKNAYLSRRTFVYQKRTRVCETFLKILWDEGFIAGYQIDQKNTSRIKIFLKYKGSTPAINLIKSISKPSRRIYYSANQIWKIDSSKSFILLTTSKGLKSILSCKKLFIGGEPLIAIN
jgi:small subunit ribosomal protein S8